MFLEGSKTCLQRFLGHPRTKDVGFPSTYSNHLDLQDRQVQPRYSIEECESLIVDLLPEQFSGHLLLQISALKPIAFSKDRETESGRRYEKESNAQTHIRPPFRKRVIGYVRDGDYGERGKMNARKRMKEGVEKWKASSPLRCLRRRDGSASRRYMRKRRNIVSCILLADSSLSGVYCC